MVTEDPIDVPAKALGDMGAFPTAEVRDADGAIVSDPEFGLTKREYFAAMAMQGIMFGTFRNDDPHLIASRAVNVADILLKELAK